MHPILSALILLLAILLATAPVDGARSLIATQHLVTVASQPMSELLRNGGFEQDGVGWMQDGFSFVNPHVRTGNAAAAATPGAATLLRQVVVFPATLSSITLHFAVDNTEFDLSDSMEICLQQAVSGSALWCTTEHASSALLVEWRLRTFRFEGLQVNPFVGQTVELSFRVPDNGIAPINQFFLDDISLTSDTGEPVLPIPPPAPPAAIELVRDGIFEGDGSAWVLREATYTRTRVRSGFKALAFTAGVRAEIRQTITFPQTIASVSVHYGIAGIEFDSGDTLQACLYRADTAWEIWCGVSESSTTQNMWVQRSQTVPTSAVRLLAGQRVDLVFRLAQNSNSINTRFFLDDVSVAVDDGQVLAQPLPTGAASQELISDGGFEGNGSAWERRDAQPTAASSASGQQSLSFYPGIDGYLRQTVTFPPMLVAAKFTLALFVTEYNGFDEIEYCLYPTDTALPLWCESEPYGPFLVNIWIKKTIVLDAGLVRRLAGKHVDVVFRQRQDNSQVSNAFARIDDISLAVETGSGMGASSIFLPLVHQ